MAIDVIVKSADIIASNSLLHRGSDSLALQINCSRWVIVSDKKIAAMKAIGMAIESWLMLYAPVI